MKTKFLGLALIAAFGFTSCQSDVSSENPEEIVETQNSVKEKKHDPNKIHVCCPLEGQLETFRLHEPGFFEGALADCDTYSHYPGGQDLVVIEDTPQSYHGEIELTNIELGDQLNFCGTLTVVEDVKVNYGGVFNLGGQMIAQGDVKVIYGGHLVIEGDVLIEGDLVLTKGATLEFLGSESSLEVLGKAKIANKAVISGEFNDVSNKIK